MVIEFIEMNDIGAQVPSCYNIYLISEDLSVVGLLRLRNYERFNMKLYNVGRCVTPRYTLLKIDRCAMLTINWNFAKLLETKELKLLQVQVLTRERRASFR